MRILEVELESNDLPATKRFYTEILGMELTDEGPGRLVIRAGHSTLTFLANPQVQPFYHFAFNIPADQFIEAHTWVSRRISLLPVQDDSTIAEFINWNARSFYCYDNNGNILEYIARFDLPSTVGKPFSGSSILSISEIGIVTGDVAQCCRDLAFEYGLGFFSRQPPRHDFAVVGDDEGLLIVVNEDRPWYPTQLKAGRFNTYVKAVEKGRLLELSVQKLIK